MQCSSHSQRVAGSLNLEDRKGKGWLAFYKVKCLFAHTGHLKPPTVRVWARKSHSIQSGKTEKQQLSVSTAETQVILAWMILLHLHNLVRFGKAANITVSTGKTESPRHSAIAQAPAAIQGQSWGADSTLLPKRMCFSASASGLSDLASSGSDSRKI